MHRQRTHAARQATAVGAGAAGSSPALDTSAASAMTSPVRSTQATPPSSSAARETLDPGAVEARAYEIFCARGGEHGRDMDDWLEAEDQLRRERAAPRTGD